MSGQGVSLNRQILRLGVPSTIATLSVPLIGIVDTALVGHLPNVAYLGAVAVASVLFDVLYWGFGFLRMGTTALTAQYYGAGDRRSCTQVLYQTSLIALSAGILVVLFQDLVAETGFNLAGGKDDVKYWGTKYFEIRILGAPLVLLTFSLTGFFRGAADAISPMWLTIVVNIVNLAGDYVLIYGNFGAPELGVLGAAWASVLAAFAGLLYGLIVLAVRYRSYLIQRPGSLFDRAKLRLLLSTNANLFGRTASLLFAQFFMLGVVARMGEIPLAANAVVLQVWGLASFAVDGFAHAAETLVGNGLGARRFVEARQMARRIILWGMGLGLGFGLLYFFALQPIAALFTRHSEVVDKVAALYLLIALIQPLNAVVFVLDGIFIGANDMGYLFKAMAVAAFAVFAPAVLILVYWLDGGLYGAWLAYNCLMIGRFLTLWPRYRADVWLRSFVEKDEEYQAQVN